MIQISQSELKKELDRIKDGIVASEIEGSTEFFNGWRAGCGSAVDAVEEWVMLHLIEQVVEPPSPPPPPLPPSPPIGYMLREGDIGPYCPKCRSSMKLKWYWWFPIWMFRTDKCVHDECENYYRFNEKIFELNQEGKKLKVDLQEIINKNGRK